MKIFLEGLIVGRLLVDWVDGFMKRKVNTENLGSRYT